MDLSGAPATAPVKKPFWKRVLKWCLWGLALFIVLIASIAGTGWWLIKKGRMIPLFMQAQMKFGGNDPLERPWPDPTAANRAAPPVRRDAASLPDADALYQMTNVWDARLSFTAAEWKAMQPKTVPTWVQFDPPDGKFSLANTNASRNGLLGSLGLDLDWTQGRFEFGGVLFTNAAVRFKGNGTFLGALKSVKKPLKVDLARGVPGRELAGVRILNFGNLVADFSCLNDALAYEFFRDAGVPAPRTAFGHVTLSIEDRWQERPLGLYIMAENIDASFARRRFGSEGAAIFKPVTYDLFQNLGDDWSAYKSVYDPKTPITAAHQKQVMDTAKLVTDADDATFKERAASVFDFDEIARFVAVNVLISSYDGFLNNGQNFYMYIDPKTGKFGFIPWDLDLSWGSFFYVGTTEQREQASIDHPWVAEHRLLERLFAIPEFKTLYRQRLIEIYQRQFVPERLFARIDALAPVIRASLVNDADLRLTKFEEAIRDKWNPEAVEINMEMGAYRPAHQLKRFIVRRHENIQAQLDGKTEGVVFHDREMPEAKRGKKPADESAAAAPK